MTLTQTDNTYDVVIVGASLGGCTAAILFARQGLRVALIERQADIEAYKKVCTHYIQASATPTLQRLGITAAIEAAGGQRNSIDVWTRWGWVRFPGSDRFYGYNIRREALDPLLRRKAVSTPGVDFLPGTTVRALLYRADRVVGLRAEGPDRRLVELRAQLVVGADGRSSPTARLAGLPAEVQPNNRFTYYAYFRHLSLSNGQRSQMWIMDEAVAYAMPNDQGLTVVAVMLPKTELAAFKQDVQDHFTRFIERLPDGPDFKAAEQVSEMMGMLDMPLRAHPPAAAGLALVGDAALASDPVWGVGCGWAFQSAEWLVEATAKALSRGREAEVDQALAQYRQKHQAGLGERHARLADFAVVRPFNFLERLMYSAAAKEPALARYTGPYRSGLAGLRRRPPFKIIVRALWLNLTGPAPEAAQSWTGSGQKVANIASGQTTPTGALKV